MGIYTKETTREIAFPLGGIGTGCISLAGNGALVDWEVRNRPNKGSCNGFSHIAVKASQAGVLLDARVLNGDFQGSRMGQYMQKDFSGYGYGPRKETMAGFPHFASHTFRGEFPVAQIAFADEHFPGDVTLTAFNPFIPLNDRDSSIPAALFEIKFCNPTAQEIEYSVCFSVGNLFEQGAVNRYAQTGGYPCIELTQESTCPGDPSYGDLCVATDTSDCSYQEYWYRGSWSDGLETFWRNFTGHHTFPHRSYGTPGVFDMASLCAHVCAAPGSNAHIRFVLTWNFPTNSNYWDPAPAGQPNTWKNYYATLFAGSRESAAYCLSNWERLYTQTMQFHDALFGSTLPEEAVEAVSANLAVLKSPTVLRLEDGSFYGWEGVHEKAGSCEGTCTHVWNYAYALPFLFPSLERSIRELDYHYNLEDSGRMQFRMRLPLGRERHQFRACVDGQMGGIIKTYREWKISGDSEWLKKLWPSVKKSLEYAWSAENEDGWDANCDGVLEGRQHHTLDMELFGPSAWLQGFYLAALKAGAEMAEYCGEPHNAARYRALYAKGKAWTETHLFNGKYYVQHIDLKDKQLLSPYPADAQHVYWNEEAQEIKYQIGEGCEIDQVCAQWHANLCGLGEIFDKQHLHAALNSLYENNFRPSMREVYNPWRLFCLNDEAGTVMCDYPEGAHKPAIPIPYCQETMTGFEYALAALMISEGMIKQGLELVRAIRSRYDGTLRNPWNEIECGSNYARSMASYSLIPTLSGFTFDMVQHEIGFAPRIQQDTFRCMWSVDAAWGVVSFRADGFLLHVVAGALPLASLRLPDAWQYNVVEVDGARVGFVCTDGNKLAFEPKITVCRSLYATR